MAEYNYLFADLRTNTIIEELPLAGVSFERKLSDVGSLDGSLLLRDKRLASKDYQSAIRPGRTAVYVDRDGSLLWGGILWSTKFISETARLEVHCETFESYAYKRLILSTLTWTDTNQIQIISDIWNYINSGPITLGSFPAVDASDPTWTPILRSWTYYWYKFHNAGEAIKEMSDRKYGADFNVDVQYSGGVPTKRFLIGYPQLGVRAANTGIVFDFPGNIKSFDWPNSAADAATRWTGIGAGEGTKINFATVETPAYYDQGYPVLDGDSSYTGIVGKDTISSHAQADLDSHKPDNPSIPSVTVKTNLDPVLGSYIPGDYARFKIFSELFGVNAQPGYHDQFYRIKEMKVTTPSQQNPESCTLKLSAVE